MKPKKRLLVTGASGFLGWNICKEAVEKWNVHGIYHENPVQIPGVVMMNADLTDFKNLSRLFDDTKPDAVIHAAAASKPNYCQAHPEKCFEINVEVSRKIAEKCAELNVPFVFTSTDMVFNGLNPPYKESDPVCPVNVYGEQKVTAEKVIQKYYPDAAICRLALMFGFSPAESTFFQQMIKAAGEGKELKLFTDEYRTFISTDAVVSALFLVLGKESGVFHVGGNERLSRYEFGKKVLRTFNLDESGLIPCSSKDVKMAASRAPDLSLDTAKLRELGFKPLSVEKQLEKLRDSKIQ